MRKSSLKNQTWGLRSSRTEKKTNLMEPLLSMDAAIAVLTGSPSSGNTITPAETVAETPTVSGPAVEKEKQETTGEESIDNPKAPKGRWPRRTADSYSNIGGKSKNKKARKTFAARMMNQK